MIEVPITVLDGRLCGALTATLLNTASIKARIIKIYTINIIDYLLSVRLVRSSCFYYQENV